MPVAKVAIDVDDLTGGLDRHAVASRLAPNQARRLRNVDVSSPGRWSLRAGWDAWITSFNVSAGVGVCLGAARIYLEGVAPFTLGAKSGGVFILPDVGGVATLWNPGSSALDTSSEKYFPHDAELVAVLDGATQPRKMTSASAAVSLFHEDSWTQMGISAPTVAPTAATFGAGGSLIDAHTYEFSYTFADEDDLGTESNASASATIVIATPNLRFRVTVTGTADTQVDMINLYVRDTTAGEEVQRFAGQVANPGASTVTIDVTANDWDDEAEVPTRNTLPPENLVFALPFKSRWWGWASDDPRVLRFTEIFEQTYWPLSYGIEMPFPRGDYIRAVAIDGDVAVVFGLTAGFIVVAQTPVDFEVRPLRLRNGAFGPRAVSPLESGGLAHAGPTGLAVLAGDQDRLLSVPFEREWREMVETASASQLAKLPVSYHGRDKELRVAVPFLPPYGDEGEWVLSLERSDVGAAPVWATTDRPIQGYVSWDGPELVTGDIGRLFSWSPTIDTLDEESTGTSANAGDLTADYEGPEFTPFGAREGRFLSFCASFEPNSGTFGVDLLVDGLTVTTIAVPIGAGLSVYGTAEYGTSTYGGRTRETVCFDLPLSAEGSSVQVKGEYVGAVPFQWFGYRITGWPEPEERGL